MFQKTQYLVVFFFLFHLFFDYLSAEGGFLVACFVPLMALPQ